MKIYSYFYIYTIRVEKFKEICDDIDLQYRKLLGYSKTRWLTFLPALERILKLFHPLKLYFLEEKKCPTILKDFFNNPFAEALLFFVHNQVSTFHKHILKIESHNISMCETFLILKELKLKLSERKPQEFLPINVKRIISKLEKDQSNEVKLFKESVQLFYQTCIEYVNQWDSAFLEMDVFEWILLQEIPLWSKVEESFSYI